MSFVSFETKGDTLKIIDSEFVEEFKRVAYSDSLLIFLASAIIKIYEKHNLNVAANLVLGLNCLFVDKYLTLL